ASPPGTTASEITSEQVHEKPPRRKPSPQQLSLFRSTFLSVHFNVRV
ncbi:hypothetical protein A2U01_0114285, partial [Trifolium medium]|nr:hypothetical protein [Trifolium medium]